MNTFQEIIKEICDKENIKMTCLSKDWIISLEKDDKTRFIAGYKFDLNKHGLGMVLDDKYAMYDVLKDKGLPIIEHYILYDEKNSFEYAKECKGFEYLKELFFKYDENLVLKPNNGTCGVDVYHVKDVETLEKVYNKMLPKSFSISVCPFYDIETEFRTILLNNEVKVLYGKIKPVIVGNGKSTIKELLQQFNYEYFKDYNNNNKDIVLGKDETFEYDWKFNLSRGSKMFRDIPKSIYDKVSSLAIKTSNTVGLGFGSVDIIKTKDGNYHIMEINSGVMMDNFIVQDENGYNIAKNIYYEAIIKMFEE